VGGGGRTDHRDLETFKEVARTTGTVLLVRTIADFLKFLLQVSLA
jgi:hypothetical protein